MEIGNEISQKIRSAIKAKLIEQGAYVDDELPDYIMVMVANKKSQKQMTDDLSLFLGANTEKFTSWLHSLLKKLQSINTDEPNSKPKTKEKSKGEKRKHRTSQGDREKKTDGERQRKTSTGDKEKTEKKKTEDKVEPGTAKVKPIQKVEEAPSDEIRIIENTDEFNEENTAAEVKELAQNSSTGKPPPTKVSKVERSADVSKSTRSSVSSSRTRSGSSSSAKSKNDSGNYSRKKPSSIVASVKRRYEELEDDEEEYDPTNPAVGSVASVVRGPTRKSSIPHSLQANKSLLMKAVTEAEKSVTTKKKAEISPESSKPAMRSDRQPVNLKHRLKTAAGLGLLSRSKRAEMNQKYTDTTNSSQGPGNKPRRSNEGFENIKYTIKNETISPKKVSPKAPALNPARVATTALTEIGRGVRVKQELVESESDEEKEEYGPPLPDTRLVQRTKPDTDSNPDSSPPGSPAVQLAQVDDDSPDPEIQQILDEAHLTLDLNDDIVDDEDFKYQIKNGKSISPEPRFIVTLDGVDPDTYKSISDVRQNLVQTVRPVLKAKPASEEQPKPVVTPTSDSSDQLVSKIQPPKIKPFNINLKDTDDEEEGEEMDTEEGDVKPTINERCRFWPSCANANDCQFVHPSIPCKTFPFCKFGEKCLYIHPNCRFDANCTRMDCPYTHSCKRKALMHPTVIHKILQVPVQQFVPQIDPFKSSKSFQPPITQSSQCRFFPNCRNMTCPFTHPKPCRYGIGCMNKSICSFYHPPLPATDKLKWSSKDNKTTSEAKTKTPAPEAAK